MAIAMLMETPVWVVLRLGLKKCWGSGIVRLDAQVPLLVPPDQTL